MSTSNILPKVEFNAVLIRFEYAHLAKANGKFDKKAQIEIERDGKRVDFFIQPLDVAHKIDFSCPVSKNTFESKEGTGNDPIWTTTYNGDYTDGDVWVPLEENDRILKVRVKSSQFDGSFTLDVTINKTPRKDYDLFDEHGHKLEGSFIRISYELGTQYEIDFQTGDPHFSPGTGTDVSILNNLNHISPIFEFLGFFYKKLKVFNPFEIGKLNPSKTELSIVMFQINGLDAISRFYQCNNRNCATEERKCEKTQRICNVARQRFFVLQKVGFPLSISVRLVSTFENQVTWFLEKLFLRTVGKNTNEISMPCYSWITEGRLKTLSKPYGFLPQVVEINEELHKLHIERLNEIEIARSKYQWHIERVIPSHMRGTEFGAYDLLPLNEKFDDFKNKDFSFLIAKGLVNVGINSKLVFNKLNVFDSLDDFDKLYNLRISEAITKPVVTANNWTDDAFFGWTYLAGTNPMHLAICKTVPPQFLKHKDLLKDSTGNPIDIEEECRKERVFLADYSGLAKYELHTKGVPSDPFIQVGRKYAAPCTCLFFVGDDKKLRPIAIQLIPDGEIYTPNDTKWQWMYAKMAVRNADAQYHQISDHWLNAHAVSETFTIALNRTVSRVHPVYRLVFPHLKYTIAINTLARRGLINPGGFVNQLTSIGEKLVDFLVDEYSVLDFTKLDLPSRLANLGFSRGNKGALIDMPLMDDGLPVWDAMFEFVGEYLRLYYKSDDDVINDIEIRALFKEIQTKGHPTHPYPNPKTIDELQMLLTTVMWTTSCYHSLVNFNQYQMYGYIPNYPLALFQPIPASKDQINEKYVMQTLPGVQHSSIQIMLLNVLSSYADNEEFLNSDRYMELIGEPKAVELLKKYKTKLNEIDDVIKKRNEDRVKRGFYEYKLLMPSHVPNSVAI